MIQQLIDRYKRLRTERFLAQTYQYSYAFVGMGQHSLTNIYPVLHYLGVPLKYICVTSERKARLIERKTAEIHLRHVGTEGQADRTEVPLYESHHLA